MNMTFVDFHNIFTINNLTIFYYKLSLKFTIEITFLFTVNLLYFLNIVFGWVDFRGMENIRRKKTEWKTQFSTVWQ